MTRVNTNAYGVSESIKGIDNGVVSQVMELKTSSPGVMRKEEIKTGFKDVGSYSRYLQGKYSYMNSGTTSMKGVPINVNVSGAFLKKCMDDPQKAAYLEENLAAIPDCVNYAVNYTKGMPGSPVMTYANYSIDENGNISIMSGCTNDPDGKIARENARRKAKEDKESKKKTSEKISRKRLEEKKLQELRKEKFDDKKNDGYSYRVTGTNIREMIFKLMEMTSNGIDGISTGIDVKM